MLRKLTDLFLAGAESYSDDSLRLFDELMSRLIVQIEREALVELSHKLSTASRAPRNVISRLSHDDDIAIAERVIEQSNMLTDHDLVHIAKTKSQAHLLAIASRAEISEPVTDVLVHRGDAEVAGKVTANAGARFSRWGLGKAVERAEADASLAVAVANRTDLPTDLLEQLVYKATSVVQQRLMANARPDVREKISQVLASVSGRVARSATTGVRETAGQEDFAQLFDKMSRCVADRNIEGLVETLATLAKLPVQAVARLVEAPSHDGLVVLGKACGIEWPDLQNVMALLVPEAVGAEGKTTALFETYAGLSPDDARRAIQFIRMNASRNAARIRELVRSENHIRI
jgi:uncharacterized protein (DUF2336 family)